MFRLCLTLAALLVLTAPRAPAAAAADDAAIVEALSEFEQPGMIRLPIGVTRGGRLIVALLDPEALAPAEHLTRLVIVAGLDGNLETLAALRANRSAPVLGADVPGRYRRVWIPIPHPDAWAGCQAGGAPQPLAFPPRGAAYNTAGEVETAVLARFLEWFAPDAVLEITRAGDTYYEQSRRDGQVVFDPHGLATFAQGSDGTSRVQLRAARIPDRLLHLDPQSFDPITREYTRIDDFLATDREHSPTAQRAIDRLQRPPLDVAGKLLEPYGHKLSPVMYQPALALVARLRYGELAGDPAQREEVERILQPYLAGERPALDDKSNGSHFAGHLIFSEWGARTGDPRATELVRQVAERAFFPDGRPREAMPSHNEMSDAVFMACPILAAAGRLTGDPRYVDMAGRQLAFMQRLCLRPDGLYRHSPLDESPWGRGNGFPALGLALALTELQAILDQPAADAAQARELREAATRVRTQMQESLRSHLQALLPHQDPTGAWRQVIDHPGAYRELTATAMITFAMARGVRRGWLDAETLTPAIDRAWRALQLRIYDDGVLIDVCTGTGKQKSLQDYLEREAILGRDERGGAMALLAAIEVAELLQQRPAK